MKPLSGRRILIVDDDKFLREIVTKKLAREGFFVVEAASGEEALAVLEKGLYELVLLDLLLPGMSGFEVLEKLRSSSSLAKIPVIVFSNLDGEEHTNRAKSLGAKDYLVKAYVEPNEIVEKVEKILREVYF